MPSSHLKQQQHAIAGFILARSTFQSVRNLFECNHPQSTNFIRPIVPTRQLHSSTQPNHFHPTTLGSATAQRRSAQRPAQDERDIHHPPRTPSIPLPMARLWPLNQLQASHRQTHFPSTRQDQTDSNDSARAKNSRNRLKKCKIVWKPQRKPAPSHTRNC